MTQLANRVSLDIPAAKSVERGLKITVLAGGPSAERDVSFKSGGAIASALESLGHEVHLADIGPDNLEALDEPVDMVFIALHGTFGEDGQLQRILDQRGIHYCGSGAMSSALSMDKVAAKCCFIESGIPTPRFDVVTTDRMDKVLANWAPPVVVKPIAEGSSVDCRIIRDTNGLQTLLQWMVEHYDRCLIEEYIKGPELTVGILDDQALPPIQIRTKREYYDYEAKYLDDDTEYLFDIDLPVSLIEKIKSLSIETHNALGCLDFSRVDWVVEEDTHQPYVLEVNTIPGFTDHSLLPKAAQRAGLDFAMLCQRIVELACGR
ncbi:MAG: D-alanine--D-alanine ligase [Planctomycetota bacterium]|nr:MAG: D-alanine--D-alanine ligase [Planctomycetota bacterium]